MTGIATVVIPMRNEEADIEGCLRAVAAQDVGAVALEVIVADGRSTDRSRAVVERLGAALDFGRFRCIDNPAGGIGSGLNAAMAEGSAPFVIRVDARSRIEPHYVRTVVGVLQRRPEVGVCGGAQVPVDRGTGVVSAGIARALGNRYTTGLSRYRRGRESGPADTVWMGAFRRQDLRDLGGWDEELAVNEDYELCERYRARGFAVWFDASLRSGYLPRPDLLSLARQYRSFGRTKGLRWASGAEMAGRHVALLAGPPVAVFCAGVGAIRLGVPKVAVGSAAVLFAADHLGSTGPARLTERSTAVAATLVSDLSWWSGVVSGFVDAKRN